MQALKTFTGLDDPKDFEIMNEQIRQIEEQSKILAEKGGDDE